MLNAADQSLTTLLSTIIQSTTDNTQRAALVAAALEHDNAWRTAVADLVFPYQTEMQDASFAMSGQLRELHVTKNDLTKQDAKP